VHGCMYGEGINLSYCIPCARERRSFLPISLFPSQPSSRVPPPTGLGIYHASPHTLTAAERRSDWEIRIINGWVPRRGGEAGSRAKERGRQSISLTRGGEARGIRGEIECGAGAGQCRYIERRGFGSLATHAAGSRAS